MRHSFIAGYGMFLYLASHIWQFIHLSRLKSDAFGPGLSTGAFALAISYRGGCWGGTR